MNRAIAAAIFCLTTVLAAAQGTFTIVRPVDGASVRETVAIRLPGNSIPEGGYIGVYVNGDFVEAIVPDVVGDNYVYRLNTKERGLPDGSATVELVLYMLFEDGPRAVDRSSITVNVDNYTSINVPDEGILLRYNLRTGQEWIYELTMHQSVAVVTQAQRALGSRGNTRTTAIEQFRMLYAVDNAYNGGQQGLVRMQAIPERGKGYIFATAAGDTEPTRYEFYEMHPLYMRITNTGREVFAAASPYFPLEGTAGEGYTTNLFAAFPLPVLPAERVSPGDVWAASFLLPDIDLDLLYEMGDLTTPVPGRGVFVGVEYYRGEPHAKISLSLEEVSGEEAGMPGIIDQEVEVQSAKLEQLIWFSLTDRVITRIELSATQEAIIEAPAPAAQPGTSGQGGDGFDRRGGGPATAGAGNTGGGGAPSTPDFGYGPFEFRPHYDANGRLQLFQQRGSGAPGGPGSGDDMQGRGGGGNIPLAGGTDAGDGSGATVGQGTSGGTSKRIMVITQSIILELEK